MDGTEKNKTEFSDPESIELSAINGERLSNVFFCDPNASWQKGSIEKNHEYIRYVLPKGTSFAGLTLSNSMQGGHLTVPPCLITVINYYVVLILYNTRNNSNYYTYNCYRTRNNIYNFTFLRVSAGKQYCLL